MFFGRTHGPFRMSLSIVGVGVLLLLSFVVFNLNNRLDHQQAVNERSVDVSHSIVEVNDRVTRRLTQLTTLTDTAGHAVNETQQLQPLLGQLHGAIAPAAQTVKQGSSGGQISNDQLTNIQGIMLTVQQKVVPLVQSAGVFGDQGKQLVAVVQGLVSDLHGAVQAAQKINQSIPLPPN